jgi:thioesterase domain-containing protein
VTTREFLQRLAALDIRVWANGDQLRVNAPQGALTAELSAELATRKPEILRLLESPGPVRSSLVPIQPSGTGPVLYGVPPDGDAFCYVPLSRQLGPSQPLFAFEAPGVDGIKTPLASIQALATHYLTDLRAFQPKGPYYISGFCLGGIVAFELARQLREQGQDVALLALIESPSPEGLRNCHRPTSFYRRRRDEIFEEVRKLSGQPWLTRVALVRSRLTRALRRRNSTAVVESDGGWHGEQTQRVFWASMAAAYTYVLRVRPYPGPIVLFLGSRELKRRRAYLRQLAWAKVAGGGLEVYVGPDSCTDYPMILRDPPSVRALAERLRHYLESPPGPPD